MVKMGQKHSWLVEVNDLTSRLGYEFWSVAAAEILKDKSISLHNRNGGRNLNSRECDVLLTTLRQRVYGK